MPKLVSLCVDYLNAIGNRRGEVPLQNPRHITLDSGICDW